MPTFGSVFLRLCDVVASLLFVLCAVVQTNDPDPELWITLYVLGGPVLTAVLSFRLLSDASFAWLAGAWLTCVTAFGVHLMRQLWQRFEWHESRSDSFVWQLMEHELGREIGGTAMLAIHALLLLTRVQSANSRLWPGLLGLAFASAVALVWYLFQHDLTARYRQETPHCNDAL
jgi:hypothetical protein